MNGLPERLRNMGLDTCEWAAYEIERLRAVEEAHIAASEEDAKRIAELEAMHETSLEVICAREQHVESQRIEIGRLQAELDELLALFDFQHERLNEADSLYVAAHPRDDCPHGYKPDLGTLVKWLVEERDNARNAIRRWRDLTLVMGSHRTCCCNACDALRQEVSDE